MQVSPERYSVYSIDRIEYAKTGWKSVDDMYKKMTAERTTKWEEDDEGKEGDNR
jgi:hypothetical protein